VNWLLFLPRGIKPPPFDHQTNSTICGHSLYELHFKDHNYKATVLDMNQVFRHVLSQHQIAYNGSANLFFFQKPISYHNSPMQYASTHAYAYTIHRLLYVESSYRYSSTVFTDRCYFYL